MTGETRIHEMIKEMEEAFAERDTLYKDRDQALEDQFRTLKEREDRLNEGDARQKQTEETLRTLEETLKTKEEDLLVRENTLKEDREAYQREKQETMARIREDQIHLNLLQAKLQNERVRQQTRWLLHEGRGRNADLQDPREGSVYAESGPVLQEIRKLRAENGNLKVVIEAMKAADKAESQNYLDLMKEKEGLEKEVADLQKEKKELFKKLLEADHVMPEQDREDEEEAGEEEIEYFSETSEEDPDEDEEKSRFEEFLGYFREEYPSDTVESFRNEDGHHGIELKTDAFRAEMLFGDRYTLVTGIPMEDSRKLRRTIHRMNGDGSMDYGYDRARREALITVPFQKEDEPEDVANLLRCILDYEVPALRKGGSR